MSSVQPCHSVPRHVNHNSSLTFSIYIYISFCTKSCFFEVGKRPRVFEEGGSLDKSQACSLPRSTTKKKCPVFFVKSVFMSLIIYLSRGALHTLGSIQSWSPLHPDLFPLVFWRSYGEGEEQQWWGRIGGDVIISSVYGVVSQRHPVAPACPGLTPPHIRIVLQSEGKADQEVGICVLGEEEVGPAGLLCSAVRVKAPPPSPLLFRTSREETESVVRNNNKKRWAATTVIVWQDCFGQS